MAMMRAVDLVRRIAPEAPRQEYIAALDSGDAQLAAAGIDTPLRLAHLVAQCGGECGFTAVRESTHYTTLDNLLNIFHNMHLSTPLLPGEAQMLLRQDHVDPPPGGCGPRTSKLARNARRLDLTLRRK